MDDPNIIMEEYIMLEEEKARRRGKVYNWETTMYGKIWYDEDVHDLRSVETEYPTIVYNDALTSEVALLCEPTYIRLEEEKARRRGQVYNWETATYGKILYDEDVHYLRSFEKEFPAIIYNDALTSEPEVSSDFENEFPAIVYNDALATDHKISSEPMASPLNDNQIDFRISFDESDDEDYTVIYDKNSFSYKIIHVNDLKTDSENYNDEVDIPSNNVVVEQLDNGIDANIDTESHEFNEDFETNHDIHRTGDGASPELSCPGVIMIGSGPELMRTGAIV
ncbi:hypothetical protein Tco_0250367 [Tanacetum coccineum]